MNICKKEGHLYRPTTSNLVRICANCGKRQMKYHGYWQDEIKPPVQRKPKPVDVNQLSMIQDETLTTVQEKSII